MKRSKISMYLLASVFVLCMVLGAFLCMLPVGLQAVKANAQETESESLHGYSLDMTSWLPATKIGFGLPMPSENIITEEGYYPAAAENMTFQREDVKHNVAKTTHDNTSYALLVTPGDSFLQCTVDIWYFGADFNLPGTPSVGIQTGDIFTIEGTFTSDSGKTLTIEKTTIRFNVRESDEKIEQTVDPLVTWENRDGSVLAKEEVLPNSKLCWRNHDNYSEGEYIYYHNGWRSESTMSDWNFAESTVTGDIVMVPVFQRSVTANVVETGYGYKSSQSTLGSDGFYLDIEDNALPVDASDWTERYTGTNVFKLVDENECVTAVMSGNVLKIEKNTYYFSIWNNFKPAAEGSTVIIEGAFSLNGDTIYVPDTKVLMHSDETGKWVVDDVVNYCVTFVGGDGETLNKQGLPLDGKITVPEEPSKAADAQYTYTFAGWYNGDKEWNFETDTATEDITLTAHFTETVNKYTVTFEADGKPYGDSQTVAYGTKVTAPQAPSKAADAQYTYTFAGWYNGDKEWDFETDTVTGNLTLTAHFTEKLNEYTVTFETDGKPYGDSQTVAYGAKVTAPQAPSKAADAQYTYTFAGWYNGDDEWDFETDTVTGNLTLSARFTSSEVEYTITFIDEKGEEIADSIVFTASTIDNIQLPAVPEKKGFTGVWDKTAEDITLADITFTALYTEVNEGGYNSTVGVATGVLAIPLCFLALSIIKKKRDE